MNPADENPEKFITYEWWRSEGIFVKALGIDNDKRGEKTIEILGLNRLILMQERAALLLELNGIATKMAAGLYEGNQTIIRQAKKEIKKSTLSEKPFAGFKRDFFRSHGYGQYISDD